MRPSRRLLATPLVLTTALMLAACGDESPNARGSEPIDTTEPTETTVPDATPQPLTIDSLDDDDLVFRLGLSGSNGGDDPYLVSVYAGGDVYLSSDSQPLGFTTFRVGDAALDELLGLATAARPFDKVVDYGEPQITDVGSTVVTVNADQGATTVSALALGVDDDALDLDPHRQRLYQVYDALCFQVSGADIALVMATDDETFWGLPTATPVAAPGAVRVTAAGRRCRTRCRATVPNAQSQRAR